MVKLCRPALKHARPAHSNPNNKRQLQLSVVSLLLAVAVLIVSSLCWYSLNSTTDSGELSVNAGTGLILNGGMGQSTLKLDSDIELLPASSVDGYNLYFPSDGYFSSNTNEIIFRRANAGDKNETFVQLDFTLASAVDEADVYIGKDSYVTVKSSNGTIVDNSAVRVAVISGLAENPVVLNPTSDTKTVSAVSDVSRFTGAFGGTETQTSYSVESGTRIIHLRNGETSNISIIIWLEGTDANCVKSIAGNTLDVELFLTCEQP